MCIEDGLLNAEAAGRLIKPIGKSLTLPIRPALSVAMTVSTFACSAAFRCSDEGNLRSFANITAPARARPRSLIR